MTLLAICILICLATRLDYCSGKCVGSRCFAFGPADETAINATAIAAVSSPVRQNLSSFLRSSSLLRSKRSTCGLAYWAERGHDCDHESNRNYGCSKDNFCWRSCDESRECHWASKGHKWCWAAIHWTENKPAYRPKTGYYAKSNYLCPSCAIRRNKFVECHAHYQCERFARYGCTDKNTCEKSHCDKWCLQTVGGFCEDHPKGTGHYGANL